MNTERELILFNIRQALNDGEVTPEEVAGLIGHISLEQMVERWME